MMILFSLGTPTRINGFNNFANAFLLFTTHLSRKHRLYKITLRLSVNSDFCYLEIGLKKNDQCLGPAS